MAAGKSSKSGMYATSLSGSKRAALPKVPKAQLATLVDSAPTGDQWIHEIKFDGYRMLTRIANGSTGLWTRNGKDWTDKFPSIAAAAEDLDLESAILDGEVVIQMPDGTTSFQGLQNALRSKRGDLLYYVFDLIYLDGYDLQNTPLLERKELLNRLLKKSKGPLRFSDHVVGHGQSIFEKACQSHLEGIISKRVDAAYRPGRGSEWVKVKCIREQEFVVTGFTDPSGSRAGLGALLLAVYDGKDLRYCGKVGTGFNTAMLLDLRRQLNRIERKTTSLSNPPRGAEARGVHWVEPRLVAQVAFTEQTEDGILRHPTFRGLREDKPATQVKWERPAPTGRVTGTSEDTNTVKKATKKSTAKKAASRTTAKKATAKKSPAKTSAIVKSPARDGAIEVEGVRMTSPDKILYPEQGTTKQDLADYYIAIQDWILPHIEGRPLTLVRCPQGRSKQCFFQKHMDELDSPYIDKIRVKEEKAARDYGTLDSIQGILTVVQMGALELHTWNSRADKLERPDRFIIDLDPDEGLSWDLVIDAAREVKALLNELGFECFAKTTGGKGFHIVTPIERRSDWNEVRDFSRAIAAAVQAASPDRYTLDVSKAKRRGRLLLDYLRNARGATAVEAFSTRARAGATVSAPISWDELESGMRSDAFNIYNLPERLKKLKKDPWKDYNETRQAITATAKKRLGMR